MYEKYELLSLYIIMTEKLDSTVIRHKFLVVMIVINNIMS